jgi:hypothetical protein
VLALEPESLPQAATASVAPATISAGRRRTCT